VPQHPRTCPTTQSEPRWFCACTHPAGEFRAELDLIGKGFTAYLPLHLQRGFGARPEAHVVPLFPRYILIQFDPAVDQWRRIYRVRGIAELIGVANDRPTPLGIGVVEELIARTSPRRIVDDPGSASFPDPAVPRQHWQNLTRLSARARGELLMRLFGRVAELEAA
jgi:hypothetical protein